MSEEGKIKVLFPEGVETLTISKNDYDRLYGEMTLENIELKEEIERLNKRTEDLKTINEEHRELNGMIRKELQQKENIIKEVRENVKGIKKINNEVYKQIDMLESFYSRKWCEDITDDILAILDKGSEMK